MSRKRIRNKTLPVDAPQTAEDRALAQWHVVKGDVLIALDDGAMSVRNLLIKLAGPKTTAGVFIANQLEPMRELGLVEPGPTVRLIREQIWELTPSGHRAARREIKARADQAEREQRADWAVAGRREPILSHEPLPAGEFRVQRPGAYAAEAWPSRHGDWLHYRDGRVVHISERDAA